MRPSISIIHIIVAVLVIIAGLLLILGILPLPEVGFIVGLVVAIIGLLLLAVPASSVRRLGLLLLVLGTYVTLRRADVIQMDIIRYIFGGILTAAGVFGIFQDMKGGDLKPVQDEEKVA